MFEPDAIDWSDEERAKYAEDHANGWQECLGRLRDLASVHTPESWLQAQISAAWA